MMRRRILVPLAAGALLASPLAACADDDTADGTTTTTEDTTTTTVLDVDQDVLDRVVEAAEATIDEGTASFTIKARQDDGDTDTTDLDDQDGTTTTTTTTTGGADDDDGDTTTTTTGTDTDSANELEVEVEGVVDFDADQRRLTFVGPEGDLDMILDGSTAYIELPATEDDDWARIELDELLDTQVGVGGPAALPFQDPADNLRILEGNVIAASEEGSEEIDGEDTDHLRVVIDLEASVEDAPEETQEALEETVARTGAQELEMHVWVDDDDLIRRVEYTLDLDQVRVDDSDVDTGDTDTGVQADPEGRLVVTFDYFDFGDDVEIELPDDENIIDIDEQAIRDSLGLDDGTTATDGTTTTTTTTDTDDDTNGTTTTADS
jgi:hypothetical protein